MNATPNPSPPGEGEPEGPLGEKVIGSVRWVVLDKWGGRITSLLVFAVLGRLLAPSDFGLIALATVYLALATVFIDSGFSQALIQRRNLDDEHSNAAFWISLSSGTVIALGLVATAPLIGSLSGEEDLVPVLQVLSATLPLTALSCVPASLLVREFGFRSLAIRRLAATAAGAAAALSFAAAGAGVWALVAQSICTSVVSVLVLWRVSAWRPSFRFSRRAARDLVSFGTSVLGIELIALVNGQADKLVVGLYFGPVELGYYYIGSRIAQVMLDMLVSVIGSLSLPTFSRMQGEPARMRRALHRMTFVSASIAFPAFAISAVLAPESIALLFGDQWANSVPIMQWLAPSAALTAIMWFDKSIFLGAGKPGTAFGVAVGQTVIGLILLAGAVQFSIVAVAISRSLRHVIFWPIRLRALRRTVALQIWPYTRHFLVPAVAALASAGAIAAWQQSAWAIQNDVIAVIALGLTAVILNVVLMVMLARDELFGTITAVLGSRQPAWFRRIA